MYRCTKAMQYLFFTIKLYLILEHEKCILLLVSRVTYFISPPLFFFRKRRRKTENQEFQNSRSYNYFLTRLACWYPRITPFDVIFSSYIQASQPAQMHDFVLIIVVSIGFKYIIFLSKYKSNISIIITTILSPTSTLVVRSQGSSF